MRKQRIERNLAFPTEESGRYDPPLEKRISFGTGVQLAAVRTNQTGCST